MKYIGVILYFLLKIQELQALFFKATLLKDSKHL